MKAGQVAPRKVAQGLRQRAWWVMRRKKIFTLAELLATLATGSEKAAGSNLGKYLKALCLAGFIVGARQKTPGEALTSNGHLRYRLLIDNGRAAPLWRASRHEVFDPNSGAVHPLPHKNAGGGDGQES